MRKVDGGGGGRGVLYGKASSSYNRKIPGVHSEQQMIIGRDRHLLSVPYSVTA